MSETLLNYASSKNIALDLKNKTLDEIAMKVLKHYREDKAAQEEFNNNAKKIIDLAKLKTKPKNHPFPSSSNVIYPIIARTILNATSNIKAELIREQKVVDPVIIGMDETFIKDAFAHWKATYLNYKLLFDKKVNWKESLERTLNLAFTIGVAYKKVYYDNVKKVVKSDLCNFDEVFVSNDEVPLSEVSRITHLQKIMTNTLISKSRAGIFVKLTDDELRIGEDAPESDIHEIIEQHLFYDLDGDGYAEPYIVTVHTETEKVIRIIARYSYDDIIFNDKQEVVDIPAECYFVRYRCLVPPDGKSNYMGFGTLLYSLNKAVNTGLNQLIDAGTLANTQSGFISKGMNIKQKDIKLVPGQLNVVPIQSGMDITKGIMPLVFKEPSNVLFQLMGMLDTSAKELSSTNDLMMGSNLPSNSKTGAVNEMVARGLKVYNSVQERQFQSITDELDIMSTCYFKYLDVEDYRSVIDDPMLKQVPDEAIFNYFNPNNNDIKLVADPTLSSDNQRLQQAQVLDTLAQQYPDVVSRVEIVKRILKASNVQNPEQILTQQDPAAPSPQEQMANAEMQQQQAELQIKAGDQQLKQQELELQAQEIALKHQQSMAKIDVDMQKAMMQSDVADRKNTVDMVNKHKELVVKQDIEEKKANAKPKTSN